MKPNEQNQIRKRSSATQTKDWHCRRQKIRRRKSRRKEPPTVASWQKSDKEKRVKNQQDATYGETGS
eukprot:3471311-Prymnesium_polylepis.1